MLVWSTPRHTFDLTARGLIMGVLNVTPDSFSDGGRHLDPGAAVERGLAMVAEGADILDIGGESTRPGADPVETAEELRRVIPVIRRLRAQTTAAISADTMKASVALAAMDAGADIINDISGLRADPAMAAAAASTGAGLVLMHMLGTPRTMQANPVYADVTAEIRAALGESLRQALDAGVASKRIALDPGIGFGKTVAHNLTILRDLPEFAIEGRPVLLGVSRKSFLGKVLGDASMEARDHGTIALTAWARGRGARIFRVHQVRENAHALRMTEAILQTG